MLLLLTLILLLVEKCFQLPAKYTNLNAAL